MKSIPTIQILVCSALLGGVAATHAQPAPAAHTAISEAAAKDKKETTAFKGEIKAIDLEERTVTVDKTKLVLTDETKIVKRGKPIKASELEIGMKVHGRMRVTDDKKNEAVRLVVKPGENERPAAARE